MFNRLKIFGFLCFFATTSYVLAGDERHIQGSTSSGGGQNSIVGKLNGSTFFSVTGNLNDNLIVKLGPSAKNQAVSSVRLSYLKNIIFSKSLNTIEINIIGYQELGGGLVRIFFEISKSPSVLNRGNVELYRGNSLLDSDTIFLR